MREHVGPEPLAELAHRRAAAGQRVLDEVERAPELVEEREVAARLRAVEARVADGAHGLGAERDGGQAIASRDLLLDEGIERVPVAVKQVEEDGLLDEGAIRLGQSRLSDGLESRRRVLTRTSRRSMTSAQSAPFGARARLRSIRSRSSPNGLAKAASLRRA